MKPENETFHTTSEGKRSKSAREIESDIAETRNALTDDIKALSDKASPAHLKQEAKQAFKDVKGAATEKAAEVKDAAIEVKDAVVEKATELKDAAVDKAQEAVDLVTETAEEVGIQARRAGEVAIEFARDNAVPLALLSVGAGWLAANQWRSRAVIDEDEELDEYPADNTTYYSTEPNSARTRREVSNRSAPGRQGQPKNALRQAGARAGKSTKAAGRKLVAAEHSLAQRATRGRDMVTEKLTSAGRASREFAQDNPLAIVVGSLVAGLGMGLLLPTSAREDQLLGPARARVRRAISEAGSAVREVGTVARDTAKDVISSVESQTH